MNKTAAFPIKKMFAPEILLLIAVSAVVFLPYAFQLTYYLDDWYFVYNNIVRGPNVFHEMFSIDRPARGYFFDLFFSVFGPAPLAHHLATYAWMAAAGIAAYLLLNILWAENRKTNLLVSLLFTLYPGYSWWVTIEYQPISASLALQIFSVLFTLLSIRAKTPGLKIFYALAALAAGVAYPALVEYAVGAEAFRFACIYLLLSRSLPNRFPLRVWAAVRSWLLYASSAMGFAVWRVFFFESGRKATNVGLFAGKFSDAPLESLTDMGNRLYLSAINAGVFAWYRPLFSRGSEISWDLPARSLVLTALAALILVSIYVYRARQRYFDEAVRSHSVPLEALALGFVSLVFGAIPVVLFGRFVNLSVYSHYGLPASLASVLLLAGLVTLLPWRRFQFVLLSVFVLASALAHSLLAEKTLVLERSLADFWWQASWRIPDIRPDATFVTIYPRPHIVDGDLGLPEAANMIYFPEPRDEHPLRYPVSAIMPTEGNIESILAGKRKDNVRYRTFDMVIRYDNIVVVTQPTPFSCVRVVDGNNFIPSEQDSESVRQISKFSKIENVRLTEGRTPPAFAFGTEPEHGWCYYFEKADLAVQAADWELAAQIGDEAFALGLVPFDAAEWYPFIQAYAMTGNVEKVKAVMARTEADSFFNAQLCEAARRTDSNFSPAGEIRELIEGHSCK